MSLAYMSKDQAVRVILFKLSSSITQDALLRVERGACISPQT